MHAAREVNGVTVFCRWAAPLVGALMLVTQACSAGPRNEPPSNSTDSPSPRAVVESVFAAFNRHDAAAMARHYTPDALLTSSERCKPMTGSAALETIHAELFAAFPDVRDEIQEVVTEGNRVAVRFVSRSETPGRAFEVTIADFFEVHDGRIVRDNTLYNTGAPCRDE